VLFSDDELADFVNEHFEATWQNVRPVPIVTIDFGNGRVLTRTLNGNVATYVCTSDGQVLDLLPGIYEPRAYRAQLEQLAKLHRWVQQNGPDRAATLASYHRLQAEALAKNEAPREFVEFESKRRIEQPTKLVLIPTRAAPPDVADAAAAITSLATAEDIAHWEVLAEDTRVNETLRRRTIHEYLAAQALVAPTDITRWLYREVLNADLDDPYLGLGKTLFASYPFDDHE
jgi:hypothetical protein